jgi:transcriptional regulator with XRE-family HTH domain
MLFKDRLRNLRQDNDITQLDLAKRLHVTRQTLSNWETQKSEPNNEFLIRLADYFEVSTDYLLGRTNISTPYPLKKHK